MRSALFMVPIFIVFPLVAHTATIHVPADQPTIQAGIDSAMAGDIVLVAPGTYIENIDFKGKAITVTSSEGLDVTIIDGNRRGSVVTFKSGEGADSLLEGFTVTNGDALHGGGIHCATSLPTITNNCISGNAASAHGGGIFCSYSSPSPIITNNTVTRNTATISGGGISCWAASPTITSNRISGNRSNSDGGGIGCWFSTSPITNNIVTGNVANNNGGGIYSLSSSPIITNSTVTGNTAKNSGGGIYCYSYYPIISNTIVWENDAPTNPEIHDEIGSLAVTYSNLKGGWPGTGNIDADPLFVDITNRDFHLTYPSPCRDFGDNSAIVSSEDFEGDPRIAWGGMVDMGADEFYTHLYITGDKAPGGAIAGKLVGLPGTIPVGLFAGTDVLPSPIPTMWGEFWLNLSSPWTLFYPLGAIPTDGVMAIPATLPGSPPAPYDVPMQALIGLGTKSFTNLCVLEVR